MVFAFLNIIHKLIGTHICQFIEQKKTPSIRAIDVAPNLLEKIFSCQSRKTYENSVQKTLLFPCQFLYELVTRSGIHFERLILVIVHVDLLIDSAEAKVVSNDVGINMIVFRKI